MSDDTINRQAAIDALWKALYEYEDKTEKQFQESEDLDLCDWMVHRIFVQNMSDIDRQTLLDLPSAERRGRWNNGFCSVCGTEALTEWNDTGGEYAFTTFCPNCGAKMNSSAAKGE